ncbi:MAG: MBL fold metallo-hydrolase [Desulfomonile tiedjei]|nr:MBL fold metallo-hydrolase [Desulfomonile tiedjei]
MSVTEIMNSLFFIERGYLNGNHFVYRSEAPALIDTAYVADFDRTERLITDLGVDLSSVGLIVNTHCHCDHIGGNKIIQERSGCDIALHSIGKHFIDTQDDWATWWRYYKQDADFFKCTRGIEHGETIEIGPHRFEAIYAPGHSSDGIVLYSRTEKVLISSDTLWENDMAVITARVEGSRACFELFASLQKLEQLEVEVVYPGHGRPFRDFLGAIERAKARLTSFMGNPKKIGNNLLKKIIVYTLMMRKGVDEESFFQRLMKTYWFPETVDLYFAGDYRAMYDQIMKDFFHRGIVKMRNGKLFTTVRP